MSSIPASPASTVIVDGTVIGLGPEDPRGASILDATEGDTIAVTTADGGTAIVRVASAVKAQGGRSVTISTEPLP